MRVVVGAGVVAAAVLAAGAGEIVADRGGEGAAYVAAGGAVVETPAIGGLGCGEMRRVLARVDDLGYREIDPLPEGHPDHALFLYEDRLAARLFRACTLRDTRRAEPRAGLWTGFATR